MSWGPHQGHSKIIAPDVFKDDSHLARKIGVGYIKEWKLIWQIAVKIGEIRFRRSSQDDGVVLAKN